METLHTVGTSSDEEELRTLESEGHLWIAQYGGQMLMDFEDVHQREEERSMTERVIGNIDGLTLNGAQLLLSRIYDGIGFNAIDDNILKQLVIARICQPRSKLATSEYLSSHFDEDINHWKIYRYMDKLQSRLQEAVQRISVSHTKGILGGRIGLLFYDVTTLWFETRARDGLRDTGFSKDGKSSEAQIVLGLLVSEGGYPLSYSIFNGKQYEGYTMIPVIDAFVKDFGLKKGDFVVVADSGLMSTKNVSLLKSAGYSYILGARIKNETDAAKSWILGQEKKDGLVTEFPYEKSVDAASGKEKVTERLILGYSAKRAANDFKNRSRQVMRLEKAYASGKLTKDNVNKRGGNKYLDMEGDVKVVINYEKAGDDAKWDGLKGYKTNTDMPAKDVIDYYHGLWVVERSFRIAKGNLEMRPIFHFTERRIEAHICICFVALKVYKELERILLRKGIPLSVDKVIEIAKTITTIRINLPINGTSISKVLYLNDQQRIIKTIIEDEI